MKKRKKIPVIAIVMLSSMIIGCLSADLFCVHNPEYLDLAQRGISPCKKYFFGTDMMGRDIFSMIWYGGRISLFIGFLASLISAMIALLYGGISGFISDKLDQILMRGLDVLFSIPSILLIIFIQAILNQQSAISIAFTMGVTGWMGMAKIIRTEVRQIRNSAYITSARKMGASFLYLLRSHFFPNIFPQIFYMIIINIGSAIASEATLSYLGLGLPVEKVSWGMMLSNADQALLSNNWWIVVIPICFLLCVILSVMEIGNYFREEKQNVCGNLVR